MPCCSNWPGPHPRLRPAVEARPASLQGRRVGKSPEIAERCSIPTPRLTCHLHPARRPQTVVVDCRGHMLGRLASVIAKQLLSGQHIVAVRCEEINISGGMVRQKAKYERFLRKRSVTNPRRGAVKFRCGGGEGRQAAPAAAPFLSARWMPPLGGSYRAAGLLRAAVGMVPARALQPPCQACPASATVEQSSMATGRRNVALGGRRPLACSSSQGVRVALASVRVPQGAGTPAGQHHTFSTAQQHMAVCPQCAAQRSAWHTRRAAAARAGRAKAVHRPLQQPHPRHMCGRPLAADTCRAATAARRAPSRILWRTVRGMIPHKTARGAAALERLKSFEGVPHPYDKVKRMVIPDALKVLRLQHGHRYCQLGPLASSIGWKHEEAVKQLEAKRKVKVRRMLGGSGSCRGGGLWSHGLARICEANAEVGSCRGWSRGLHVAARWCMDGSAAGATPDFGQPLPAQEHPFFAAG